MTAILLGYAACAVGATYVHARECAVCTEGKSSLSPFMVGLVLWPFVLPIQGVPLLCRVARNHAAVERELRLEARR